MANASTGTSDPFANVDPNIRVNIPIVRWMQFAFRVRAETEEFAAAIREVLIVRALRDLRGPYANTSIHANQVRAETGVHAFPMAMVIGALVKTDGREFVAKNT